MAKKTKKERPTLPPDTPPEAIAVNDSSLPPYLSISKSKEFLVDASRVLGPAGLREFFREGPEGIEEVLRALNENPFDDLALVDNGKIMAVIPAISRRAFDALVDEANTWRQQLAKKAAPILVMLLNRCAKSSYEAKVEAVKHVNQFLDSVGLIVIYTDDKGHKFPSRLVAGVGDTERVGRFGFNYKKGKKRVTDYLEKGGYVASLSLAPLPSCESSDFS